MSNETEKRWLVKVGYCYPSEAPRDTLEMDVRIFKSEAEAVEALNGIIREYWTAETEYGALADCRGRSQGESGKWDDWSYSEDGKLAWCFFGDGHGYKGEVKEVEI